MPIKLEIKKKLISRSERVKCVDLHPELPWVLVSLYSGNITILDYSNQTTVKTFENSLAPVRCAKFLVRKQWIVSGADDLIIRIYNYNTMEKIIQFEGHTDYIRHIMVHPTQPYLLSSSDDATIKIWDFEKNCQLIRTLDDHVHYVMMMALNPRDFNTFCSASLDRTIKIWTLSGNSTKANFTLNGHTSGINCVDYYKGDKPYIISGGDDKVIKIWDYQTKQCIHTLEGHQNNISAAIFHPELPIIITAAEDGVARLWHSQTYRLETTLNYNMDRVWSVDIGKENSNVLALGYDEGTIVIKIGSDEPLVSMNNGKVVWAKNLEIHSANLKALDVTNQDLVKEGEPINVNQKELGASDFYPQNIIYAPNGHQFAICNDQEYSIFRSQTFKNNGFGQGMDFIWSHQGDYAVREGNSIKIFKNNNVLHCELKVDYVIEGLFGGPLLAAKSNEFLIFYDWETAAVIRRVDIAAKKLFWNEQNTQVAISSGEDIYMLAFKSQILKELQENQQSSQDGFEEAFDLLNEYHETVVSAIWVENLFFFTNQNGKINYALMGKVFSFAHTDKKKYLIGYIPSQNRLYLTDKFFNFVCFELPLNMVQYQSAISQNEIQKARSLISEIPEDYLDKVAKFLDTVDQKQEAFLIVKDLELKFELGLTLGYIEEAYKIACQTKNINQYKQVGDIALLHGKIDLAIQCFQASEDLGSLLLIYSSLGLKQEMQALGKKAEELMRMNIAFTCYYVLADLDKCIEVLINSKRYMEAAIFAKSYYPSQITYCVDIWKKSLEKDYPITAQKIADPMDYLDQESFKDLKILLQLEKFNQYLKEQTQVPAHHFEDLHKLMKIEIFQEVQENPNVDLNQYIKEFQSLISTENPLFQELEKPVDNQNNNNIEDEVMQSNNQQYN